jgi:uncharacterized membrane protein YhaH (DUF805 family)
MDFSNEILLVMLIGVVASATNTDLANNTNMLLLLLLVLIQCGCCNPSNMCGTSCCGNRTSFFM